MAERPSYDEIEHTADVGAEFAAPDLEGAFELAGAVMFDLISDLDGVGETWRREIRIKGRRGDLENLMVRWLTELLYVFESERVLLSSFEVVRLGDEILEAAVAGEPLDMGRHAIKVEIKAPTYHDIAVKETASGWRVRVIFDT